MYICYKGSIISLLGITKRKDRGREEWRGVHKS